MKPELLAPEPSCPMVGMIYKGTNIMRFLTLIPICAVLLLSACSNQGPPPNRKSAPDINQQTQGECH